MKALQRRKTARLLRARMGHSASGSRLRSPPGARLCSDTGQLVDGKPASTIDALNSSSSAAGAGVGVLRRSVRHTGAAPRGSRSYGRSRGSASYTEPISAAIAAVVVAASGPTTLQANPMTMM